MPEPNDHDEKCGCGKSLAGAIRKALDANPGAVPADFSHLIPRGLSGAEALQHLQDIAASASAGAPGGGSATGRGLSVLSQDAGSSPCYANAPAVRTYLADRGPLGYVPQCNSPRGGKR
jgi:hypothetical protein